MTTLRIVPVYEDHKYYPILVKTGGSYKIVEMLGKDVNRYNNSLYENTKTSKSYSSRYV